MQGLQLLLILLVAAVGAYGGTYLREKGKNLATREDLDPIIRGQETIKQQLAHSTFIEGRRFDLTREVIWDLQKQLAIMMEAAVNLNAASHVDSLHERCQEELDRLVTAVLETATLRALAGSLIPDPVGARLDAAVRKACKGIPRDAFLQQSEFEALSNGIHSAILGVQVVARSALFNEPLGPEPESTLRRTGAAAGSGFAK